MAASTTLGTMQGIPPTSPLFLTFFPFLAPTNLNSEQKRQKEAARAQDCPPTVKRVIFPSSALPNCNVHGETSERLGGLPYWF